MTESTPLAASIIFAATYAILGIQGIPRIHIDRPSGAVLGVEVSGLTTLLFEKSRFFLEQRSFLAGLGFAGVVAVVSNLVSNVPAVMLYAPLVEVQAAREQLWLLLAMASTLAGNLTLIGSIANLIVLEQTKDEVQISFIEYLRAGLPLTVLTLLLGVVLVSR